MRIDEKVYGNIEIKEKVFEDLINLSSIQRLKLINKFKKIKIILNN